MLTGRCLFVGSAVMAVAVTPLTAQTVRDPTAGAGLTGYGAAVAVGEGEMFVAEPLNAHTHGTVYVYRRAGGSPEWAEAMRLKASDAATGDYFGRALVWDGIHLLVGATAVDSSRGALYVFEKGPRGAWAEAARLVPEGLRAGDAFGRVAAGGRGVALVATLGQDSGAGAVYVFRRDARGRWAQEARLAASDREPEDGFGSAVTVDGALALIGANRKRGGGAAYVFRYDSTASTWTQQARLRPRNQDSTDMFGSSVYLDGTRAFVGAPRHNGVGAVFVFERDTTGRWRERGMLLPYDGTIGMRFGEAMAAAAPGELWVGAPGANGFEGRIYVFRHANGEVAGVSKLAAATPEGGEGFGAPIEVHGNVAVVGLLADDYGEGSVAVFHRVAGQWQPAAKLVGEVSGFPPIVGREVRCEGGAVGSFPCSDVDLLAFLPVAAVGGGRGVRMNDVWGWTDPVTGKEWVIAGRIDGAAFIDISDPHNPVFAANLPLTPGANPSTWRDMKVYKDHVFIVADGAGPHGMQVFDLTRLRSIRHPPQTVEPDVVYDRIHSAHNIVINEATGFAYAVGASGGGETCGGALHMIDIREPTRPTFAGCHADPRTGRRRTGYTHDAQCVIYHGPDAEHRGKEICFHAAETALGISDVSDKASPASLAVAEYPNVGYSHQGWLTEDHRYFYMDDELDEIAGSVSRTRTLVWDVSDLDDPVLVKEFFGTTGASDHNLYVRGHYVYQSNYVAGLRILDISNPEDPREVAFFDTVPYGENTPGFGGSWSNFPFFESGTIVVTSGREGVFLVRHRPSRAIP